jgi:hypothetical protein
MRSTKGGNKEYYFIPLAFLNFMYLRHFRFIILLYVMSIMYTIRVLHYTLNYIVNTEKNIRENKARKKG